MRRFSLGVLLLAVAACTAETIGPSVTQAEDWFTPPEPGACRKLCCASSDCEAGASCRPFNAAWGTLGVCTQGSAGSTDWPQADGAGGDEGGLAEPGDVAASAVQLPDGCWIYDTPECNPLTNAGCAEGQACDLYTGDAEEELEPGEEAVEPAVMCFTSEALLTAGEACDGVYGPYCAPGHHCLAE